MFKIEVTGRMPESVCLDYCIVTCSRSTYNVGSDAVIILMLTEYFIILINSILMETAFPSLLDVLFRNASTL